MINRPECTFNMTGLESTHPDVIFNNFQDGFHVARRSSRSWVGLSTDLMIEQVHVRIMKTNGGLTRGRGVTVHQKIVWSLSVSAYAEVNREKIRHTVPENPMIDKKMINILSVRILCHFINHMVDTEIIHLFLIPVKNISSHCLTVAILILMR